MPKKPCNTRTPARRLFEPHEKINATNPTDKNTLTSFAVHKVEIMAVYFNSILLLILLCLNHSRFVVFQNAEDFEVRKRLVLNVVQEKGQDLITNLLHAFVFCLHTYVLPDIADVIMELMLIDKVVKLMIMLHYDILL